jgi:hypothetical protein
MFWSTLIFADIDSLKQIAQDDTINAILVGIKSKSSSGEKVSELNISYELNLTKKPSNFFYEFNLKDKLLILELFDTKKKANLDTSELQPPIFGYYVEKNKIDLNAGGKEGKPDWHDETKVVFKLNHHPKIVVEEKNNAILINYKWSSDSSKIKEYVVTPGMSIIDPGPWINIVFWVLIIGGTIILLVAIGNVK